MRPRPLLVATLVTLSLSTVPAAADPTLPSITGSDLDGLTFVTDPVEPVDAPPVTTSTVQAASSTCPTPSDPKPAPRFTDTTGNVHADNIDCVARWGIAQGTSATSYHPRRDVTRAQMATFVANLIRATGTPLPTGTDRFADDDGLVHEPNINALANAGIISGIRDGTYAPANQVTRAQAATILAGAYRHLTGADLPRGRDRFTDDDGLVHEPNIDRLANAGIINGLTATTFGPTQSLKRDQMASLLARFLGETTPGGTIWYSEYGELRAIDAANPTHRRIAYEYGSTDTFTVNPSRGEFTYIDDGPAGEYLNEVHIRSLTDNASRGSFRWIDQCQGLNHRRPQTVPLASPDGQWFVAMMDNGWPYNVEIRDRTGGCVFEFAREAVAPNSWTWFADGDLLVVLNTTLDPDIPDDWALVRIPRTSIAAKAGEIHVLRTFSGTNPPHNPAISHGQDQIAYIWDRGLHVLDLSSGGRSAAGSPHWVARSSADLMWPAFSPDDRSIVLRNRTGSGGMGVPSSGQVHVVANHRGPTTLVQANGPTQLEIARNRGEQPRAFDAKGPFYWAR